MLPETKKNQENWSILQHLQETLIVKKFKKPIIYSNLQPNFEDKKQNSNTGIDISPMKDENFEQEILSPRMGAECKYDSTKNVYQNIWNTYELMKEPLGDPEFQVDWRNIGIVTEVLDQGLCPASWAYSAVSAIESYFALEFNENVRKLSIQQLQDCSVETDNNNDKSDTTVHTRCAPWSADKAFKLIQQSGGIMLEATYPLVENQKVDNIAAKCNFEFDKSFGQVSGGPFNFSPYDDNNIIKHLLSEGPVVAMIDGTGLNHYDFEKKKIWDGSWEEDTKDGKAHKCKQTQAALNLSVLLVGIGKDTDSNQHYYRVKNSMGKDWGDGGYFNLQFDRNICGQSICASYPKINPTEYQSEFFG